MADGPALALQAALVATLKADAGVTAIVAGRGYDEPPQNVAFPYIRLGVLVLEPFRTDAKVAWTVTFGIEAHSRPVSGRVLATRAAQAVIAALDEQPLSVPGFSLAWSQFITSTTSRAGDGESYIATAAFEAVLDA